MDEQRPGQVIAPGGSGSTPEVPVSAPPQGDGNEQSSPDHDTQTTDAPASPWKYEAASGNNADASGYPTGGQPEVDENETVSWSASEFIAHHKTASWYLQLVLGAIILAALVFFITHDKLSVVVI